VALLLSLPNIDVNLSMTNGASPLIISAYLGHASCVKQLLSHSNIDTSRRFQDKTALHWCQADSELIRKWTQVPMKWRKANLVVRTEVLKYDVCTDAGGTHAMYTINVQATMCIGSDRESRESREWTIRHRYKTFHLLHNALKQRFGRLRVRLPKKTLFRKTNREFLAARQEGLNLYLKRITTLPGFGEIDAMLTFFSVQEHFPEWEWCRRINKVKWDFLLSQVNAEGRVQIIQLLTQAGDNNGATNASAENTVAEKQHSCILS